MLPGTQEVEAGGPRTDTRLGKSVKLLEKNTLKLKKKKKKKGLGAWLKRQSTCLESQKP
jgi:hypothetical protein